MSSQMGPDTDAKDFAPEKSQGTGSYPVASVLCMMGKSTEAIGWQKHSSRNDCPAATGDLFRTWVAAQTGASLQVLLQLQ